LLIQTEQLINLEENLDWGTHGSLDINLSNVLPLLLQQRSEEIDRKLRVDNEFLVTHGDVSDSNVEAHNLLHLEFDSGFDLVDLLLHIIRRGDKGRELSSLGKSGTQKTRNLLDHVIGSHEEIITLGKLLHHLLVLVEFLKILDTHVVNTDTVGLFTMGSISKNTALKTGTRDTGKLEGSRETLVADGVVVLQSDLTFDGFGEVTLLSRLVLSVEFDTLTASEGKDISDSLVKDC
jgi:hypothetical protein